MKNSQMRIFITQKHDYLLLEPPFLGTILIIINFWSDDNRMTTTGAIIKFVRKRNGLTQDELGEVLGVKKSAIQKYENGSVTNLKTEVIRRFCVHFKVPAWILIFPEYVVEDSMDGTIEKAFVAALELDEAGRKKTLEYIEDLRATGKYQQK